MTYTLAMSPADEAFIRDCAARENISVSDFLLRTVKEKIEDMKDLALYEKAMAEYKADPTTYTLDEMEERLGIR